MKSGDGDARMRSAIVRDLRRALGWSQSRLARELCAVAGIDTVTRETVSRWESGRRAPGPWWLRHLATALQVPLEVLERHPGPLGSLTDVSGTTIAPLVASDLIERGFAAALRTRHPTADDWAEAVDTYGRDYMTSGAAEIQRRVAADLVVLQQQLDSPSMWATAARLATLYAKTFPGSDGVKAAVWYRHAASFADRSGDAEVRVWARGRAAIALGYEGASSQVAEVLAAQALAAADRPSLGRLNAVMGLAHVAALRGDAAGAADLLQEGRRVFDAAGSDDTDTDYAVPWWRFNVFVSLLAARLGQEVLAEEAQSEARRSLPASMPRFRTHLDMHRGLLLARAGDRSGGVGLARAALDTLPRDKHSLTLRMLMSEVEGR